MKKVFLFIMSIFAMGITAAQSVSDWDFVPPTTDNNMSVVFPAGTLTDFAGGFLMAFVDGAPASVSSEIDADGSGGVAVIGSDNLCGCDLADGGESISFAILLNGTIIVITDVDPPVTYAANSFHMISSEVIDFNIDGNPVVFGCMDATYMEYNAAANAPDNAACTTIIVTGCMDVLADNYNAEANVGSECFFTGCMDVFADNYLANANVVGECIFFGCMDATACNYDDGANTDDLSCVGLFGCTNDAYYEYNEAATCDDATCSALIVPGCEDVTMFNYNASATEDDGSCYSVMLGCINPSADNYIQPIDDVMVDANTDDVPTLCTYSGLNPWGPGAGSEEAPTYYSSNNMSVLFPLESEVWVSSDLLNNDILFAAYETSKLENETYGYSEIASMESAGAVLWDLGEEIESIGMTIFGSDGFDSGFQENESLTWLVKRDGVIYNAAVTFVNPTVSGVYDDGDYVLIQSVSIGAPFYDGCTEATSPNFNPMANTPDGSCDTPYSIGCMDENKVNYAGPGASPTHSSASNLGNPFGENLGYDLITGAQLNTGIAANVSNDDMCQDEVGGCTDPMAINYDPMATVNNITCDWTIGGMVVYNVDEDGFIIESDDNYVYADDFEHYATLLGAGAIDEDAHIAENVASIMEWIEGDEAADALELATTISTMQNDYDVNETIWNEMFIADEAADALELATTIATMQNDYDVNETIWNEMFIADEAADALELASTISDAQDLLDLTVSNAQDLLDATIADYTSQLEVASIDALNAANLAIETLNSQIETDSLAFVNTVTELNEEIDYYSSPIVINLNPQWNTIGYYLHHPSPVVAQFENQFDNINDINIVKNNEGSFYWPEFGYDGLVMLEPGQGYQVRIKDGAVGNPNFIFDLNFTEDDLRLLSPTVPTWAIDMELEAHPNDVRTLVRVVNMLGQEVNPTEQFNGEVLLYMYNDGTVEKKMVE
jgi:hypothetical protein